MKHSDNVDEFLEGDVKPKPKPKDDNSVWFPIKNLPSKSKQYPKGTVIEGKSIGYRHIKKFAQVDESTAVHVMRKIADDCVRGIDIGNITTEDMRYIFLWLRANSMQDSDFDMTYTCQHCEGVSPLKVNPAEFDMTFLKLGLKPIIINGKEIAISLITLDRDSEVNKAIESFTEEFDDWEEEDSDDVILSSWVTKIDGNDMSVSDAYRELFIKWPPDDVLKLLKHIKQFDYGLHDTVQASCTRCSKNNSVGIEFSDLFFFPTV